MTKPRLLSVGLVILGLTSLVVPCACSSKSATVRRQSNQATIDLSKDPEELRNQILTLIPIGTELGAAQAILESKGFRCNRKESDSEPKVQKLYGRLDKRFDLWVTETWSVIIESQEDRVTELDVKYWATGP